MQSSPRAIHRSARVEDEFPVRINYISCPPPPGTTPKGTILLIHGFPQTSYQFRHVIHPLSEGGYHVIAPDYRGAGSSSKPSEGFTKGIMANDLQSLVKYVLGIHGRIHVVGHDIGGMVAHAYATRYPDHVASVVWGECPLPGTTAYEKDKGLREQFHFMFHCEPDLAGALVAGRERLYLKHFFDKLSYNTAAITNEDLDHYARDYEQPGAMRCAFRAYEAFEQDAEWNRYFLGRSGKCKVPAMAFSGEFSRHKDDAEEMVRDMYEDVEVGVVEGSRHYLAEENPEDFVKKVLSFVGKHDGKQLAEWMLPYPKPGHLRT